MSYVAAQTGKRLLDLTGDNQAGAAIIMIIIIKYSLTKNLQAHVASNAQRCKDPREQASEPE